MILNKWFWKGTKFFFLKAYLKFSPQGPSHYWGQSSSCFYIFFIGKWGPTWAPAKVIKTLETVFYEIIKWI